VLLAIVHGVERFRWAALIGGLVAAAGVAIAYGGVAAQGVPLVSVLAFMVAALAFAETNIVVKRLPPMDPASANTIGTGVAAVILLALSVLFGESRELPERTETWLAVGYLTTLGTLAVFLLFLYVIRRWRASAVAYEFVLSPFVAVTLGVLLLGEQVTPLFLVGGGLVLIGVYLGALAPAAAEPPAGPAPEPKS